MTKKEYFDVLLALKKIITGTEWEGHLFVVGGACRDFLMGYPIKDIDLVVDLPNGGIEFANWLCQNHYLVYEPVTYPTYGTAMFKLLEFPELELEIVETRKEQYKDKESRNPDVVYGSLAEDCRRRDLTINALYYDVTNEKIIDLVGGQEDIKNHIIRTPSDANVIFNDDPLRQMRVLRFCCRYGFKMGDLADDIKRNAHRMCIITQERITDEIKKTLMSAIHPSMAFLMWKDCGLIDEILPEISKKNDLFYVNIGNQLNRIKGEFGDNVIPELYFAAIFKDNWDVLKRMKLPNEFIRLTVKIINSLEWVNCYVSDKIVRKFGVTFGEHTDLCVGFITTYIEAYHISAEYHQWLNCFTDKVKELKEDGTMFDHTTTLPIDGNDIMERFDLKPSRTVKKLLDQAWGYYYNHPKTSKENLVSYLQSSNIICG